MNRRDALKLGAIVALAGLTSSAATALPAPDLNARGLTAEDAGVSDVWWRRRWGWRRPWGWRRRWHRRRYYW